MSLYLQVKNREYIQFYLIKPKLYFKYSSSRPIHGLSPSFFSLFVSPPLCPTPSLSRPLPATPPHCPTLLFLSCPPSLPLSLSPHLSLTLYLSLFYLHPALYYLYPSSFLIHSYSIPPSHILVLPYFLLFFISNTTFKPILL